MRKHKILVELRRRHYWDDTCLSCERASWLPHADDCVTENAALQEVSRQSAWEYYSSAVRSKLTAGVEANSDLSEADAMDLAVEEVSAVRRLRRKSRPTHLQRRIFVTDDIVKRLRTRADGTDIWSDEGDYELHRAATDEIERLRTVNENLHSVIERLGDHLLETEDRNE